MQIRSRRLALTASLLISGALVVTGCSGASEPEDPAVTAIDFGADAVATPGNVELAFGEPAWITKTDAQGTPSAAVSVLEIIEGDAAIYDEWGEDGAQFAGTTPYYVVVQVTHQTDDRTEFAVYPVSDSGETTQYVAQTFGSSQLTTGTFDCPLTLPEYDETTRTEITCVIALAEDGETIVGGLYNGGGYSGFQLTGSDSEYGTAPIYWLDTATPGPIEYAAEAVDFGTAGSATPPGTRVAQGEPAWLPLPSDTSKIIGTSVLKVIPGDVSFFDRYPNAADFAQYTPTFIVVQLQYPDDATAESRALPPLHPMQSDGEYSSWMTPSNPLAAFGQGPGLQECGLVLPMYDPETRTYVGCITALTEGTVTIDQVVYDGESYSAFIAQDELGYFSAPVIFD